jgi:hypothetical protein
MRVKPSLMATVMLSAIVACACSITTTTTNPAPGDPGNPGSDGGSSGDVPLDGGAPRDGAAPPTDAAAPGTDARAAADGTAPGDSAAPDDRLQPLALGRTWTYDVQSVGTGYCASGTHDVTVLGHATVDGRDAFQVSSFCSGIASAYETVNGDQVDVDYQGAWNHYLDVPVQDGHSWPYFNSSYTWHAVPTITVPAGTFTGCWKASQNVTYTAYATFCRGVGMVESYSQDLAGNGWDAKLSAKNF